MIWNGGTFSWNWKVPSLNCVCAPLWMKLTGKLPVMVIPAAPMLDHYQPWSKHTLRKLAFDCVCETRIRCNSYLMIQSMVLFRASTTSEPEPSCPKKESYLNEKDFQKIQTQHESDHHRSDHPIFIGWCTAYGAVPKSQAHICTKKHIQANI